MKGGGFDHLKIPHTTNLQFSYGYYKDLDHIFYENVQYPIQQTVAHSSIQSFFCLEC